METTSIVVLYGGILFTVQLYTKHVLGIRIIRLTELSRPFYSERLGRRGSYIPSLILIRLEVWRNRDERSE